MGKRFIHGRRNAENYGRNIMPHAKPNAAIILQYSMSSLHSVIILVGMMMQYGIDSLDWASRSSDLNENEYTLGNPLENVLRDQPVAIPG